MTLKSSSLMCKLSRYPHTDIEGFEDPDPSRREGAAECREGSTVSHPTSSRHGRTLCRTLAERTKTYVRNFSLLLSDLTALLLLNNLFILAWHKRDRDMETLKWEYKVHAEQAHGGGSVLSFTTGNADLSKR